MEEKGNANNLKTNIIDYLRLRNQQVLEIFSLKEVLFIFKASKKESSIMKVESMSSQQILDSCSVTISSVTRLLIYCCHTFFY